MIRAMIENGTIKPLEPLPTEWRDGREVVVESVDDMPRSDAEFERWFDELETLVGMLNPEDQLRMETAIAEANRIAKDQMRQKMGLP